MTDKKLTDKEIIKALECCSKKICKQCPNFSEDIECSEKLINVTLDLIARQLHESKEQYEEAQTEIDRLKNENENLRKAIKNAIKINEEGEKQLLKMRSEAVKEFAERLKEEYAQGINWFSVKEHYFVNVEDIDNLVKEVVNQVQNLMLEQQENQVFQAIQKTGVIVDKEELQKALKYDREQYQNGYNDGYTDGANAMLAKLNANLQGVIDLNYLDTLHKEVAGKNNA